MYDPIQDGIEKNIQSVIYRETKPPKEFSDLVHCYWELKTQAPLVEEFFLHALPDACVNILFNQKDTKIAGVTALRTTYESLNLGKVFSYAGIQFFPGVWQGDQNETIDRFVGEPYLGDLPLIKTGNALSRVEFLAKSPVFSELVSQLIERKFVSLNVITKKILSNLESIHGVADMATITGKSPRQLQRILKKSTGFSPHDFLKVIRLQQSFKQHYLDSYTDQSHFIRSFRKITGHTPADYYRKYDV
jgi:AraC-like DNA-binding protein